MASRGKVITIEIADADFAALVTLANGLGLKPGEEAAQLLHDAIYGALEKLAEPDPRTLVAIHHMRQLRLKILTEQLIDLAAIAIQTGDESEMDIVTNLCASNMISVDAIMQIAGSREKISPSSVFEPGEPEPVARAKKIIQQAFVESRGAPILSRVMKERFAKAGISDGVWKLAKNSMGIKSGHIGALWCWKLQPQIDFNLIEVVDA